MKLLIYISNQNSHFYILSRSINRRIYRNFISVISYLVIVFQFILLVGCNHENSKNENLKLGLLSLISTESYNEIYDWNLPAGFPTPAVPQSNPMSQAKVELGKFLFYDTRLSGNQTQSCATCHLQSLGFSDGSIVGIGSTGAVHPRNPQPLSNLAYLSRFTWMNTNIKTLEQQARSATFWNHSSRVGFR
jgi:cytochrome c peroxidase